MSNPLTDFTNTLCNLQGELSNMSMRLDEDGKAEEALKLEVLCCDLGDHIKQLQAQSLAIWQGFAISMKSDAESACTEVNSCLDEAKKDTQKIQKITKLLKSVDKLAEKVLKLV